jgi:hypothetical protein
MQVPPGTTYGAWVVIREVERAKTNRRLECRCAGCGTVTVKWLSNLLQGKTSCLTCRPWSEVNLAGRNAVIAARRERSQESDAGRICLTCGQWKPWSAFSSDTRRTRGKTSNCMECGNWRSIKATYGITRAEWDWLHERQRGCCALCGENGGKRLSVDHDHSCCGRGKACKLCIRGLLCDICNRSIVGHVENRPLLRARFADYLDNRPFSTAAVQTAPH